MVVKSMYQDELNTDKNSWNKEWANLEESSKEIIEVSRNRNWNNRSPNFSQNRPLALRTDVMNKNTFRALRREYKSLFDSYLTSNLITNSRCKRLFRANLNRFAAFLRSSTEAGQRVEEVANTVEFVQVLGMFISVTAMKKQLSGWDQPKLATFNEVVSAYSHKRFAEYLSKPEVGLVIQMLVEKVTVEGLVDNHPALRANKEEYEEHVQALLNSTVKHKYPWS